MRSLNEGHARVSPRVSPRALHPLPCPSSHPPPLPLRSHAAHNYVACHLTLVEFREFFGEGSCAFGATYTKAIEDRLSRGWSGRKSWAHTIESMRARYCESAATLTTLRESGGVVTITVIGGLLDIHSVPTTKRAITIRVPEGYAPHAHATTKMFLSNAYEKVHGEANPLSWTAQELRSDFRITQCPRSGHMHIQSDTFFGLRVAFAIVSPDIVPPIASALAGSYSIYFDDAWKTAPPSSSPTNAAALMSAQDVSWQTGLRAEAVALGRSSAKRFAELQVLWALAGG